MNSYTVHINSYINMNSNVRRTHECVLVRMCIWNRLDAYVVKRTRTHECVLVRMSRCNLDGQTTSRCNLDGHTTTSII